MPTTAHWARRTALTITYALTVASALAHPASGIAVTQSGDVYFTDVRRGLMKRAAAGQRTTLHPEGFHWLALDTTGAFAHFDFDHSPRLAGTIRRRTPPGVRPALLTASDSPIAVSPTGYLYFVCDDDQLKPGMLQIARVSPDGSARLLNPDLPRLSRQLGGIRDLAAGPDGAIYASFAQAIVKIAADGTIGPVHRNIPLTDCERNPPSVSQLPFLRGIAVDARGVVYAAATGCRRVIAIRPDSSVSIVGRSEAPWSPSGVAVQDGAVYVLEQIDGNSEAHEDWPPRVRKIDAGGKSTTLIDLSRGSAGSATQSRGESTP